VESILKNQKKEEQMEEKLRIANIQDPDPDLRVDPEPDKLTMETHYMCQIYLAE